MKRTALIATLGVFAAGGLGLGVGWYVADEDNDDGRTNVAQVERSATVAPDDAVKHGGEMPPDMHAKDPAPVEPPGTQADDSDVADIEKEIFRQGWAQLPDLTAAECADVEFYGIDVAVEAFRADWDRRLQTEENVPFQVDVVEEFLIEQCDL